MLSSPVRPEEPRPWWSNVSVSWLNRLIAKGIGGDLHEEDLSLPATEATDACHARFRTAWAEQLEKPQPSLFRALWTTFWKDLLVAAVLKLAWGALLLVASSYFVRALLQWLSAADREERVEEGWILSAFYFLACVLLCICLQQMGLSGSKLGLRVKAAVTTAVYRKSLRESRDPNSLDIVSLVGTDCSKLGEACVNLNFLWSGIVEALAIIGVLIGFTGVSALPGLGVLAVVLPLQYGIGLVIASWRKDVVASADARVSLMDEVLRAIKIVKCYAWERSFAALVGARRAEEMRLSRLSGILKSVSLAFVFALPPLIAISIFGTYEALGNNLTSVLAFTTLSLFNTLRLPLVVLPKCLRSTAEGLAALRRLQIYLLAPEVVKPPKASTLGVAIDRATFTYDRSGANPVLQDFSLHVRPGQLCMIAGPVGSGKSSVVNAVIGVLHRTRGESAVGGRIAYVPQQPWIQHGTIKDNILFGLPYDEERYANVLYACALVRDLELMEEGDETEIGERGINLSGGQKQRIALARALYSQADIYVLDSPLSALDQFTGQHIFRHVIRDMMRDSAVILVTHQLELLCRAHIVLIMQRCQAVYSGPFDEAACRRHFTAFPTASGGGAGTAAAVAAAGATAAVTGATAAAGALTADSTTAAVAAPSAAAAAASSSSSSADHGTIVMTRRMSSSGRITVSKERSGSRSNLVRERAQSQARLALEMARPKRRSMLAARPAKADSGSSTSGYWIFVKEAGVLLVLMNLVVFVATQVCRIYSDTFISAWVQEKYDHSQRWYVGIYGGYVGTFIVLLLLRGTYFYTIFRQAATELHRKMFDRVIRAPLGFFTVTPLGRLLGSFSKDMDQVDEALQDNMHMVVIYFLILGTTMGVVIRVLPYFAAVFGFLLLSFFWFLRKYLAASRTMKAIASKAHNSMLAHVSETLSGMNVIKAFDAEERFVARSVHLLDRSQRSVSSLDHLQVWLSFRVDLIACLLCLGTCLFCVGLREEILPAESGLAISNAFQILLFFSLMVRTAAEIDASISAVERIAELEEVPVEVDRPLDHDSCPPDSWPAHGEIAFLNVEMSYFPHTPTVLKGVTVNVRAGEKVGVVGRTGAGKSTLLSCLFRLVELRAGSVLIDNIDISVLNLEELRKRVAIIPQEPVMFKGTVRSNLDPFNLFSDDELWHSLERCELAPLVRAHPDGLLFPVAEMGRNFSLGQQQLLCLARAILNRSKVLVLDEATAALDSETDQLVQATVKREFADRTVLTIAHRLDTIIHSDRVLVLDAGRVAEFDEPATLLSNPHGIFSQLVEQTGSAADALRRTALEFQESRRAQAAADAAAEEAAEEELNVILEEDDEDEDEDEDEDVEEAGDERKAQ